MGALLLFVGMLLGMVLLLVISVIAEIFTESNFRKELFHIKVAVKPVFTNNNEQWEVHYKYGIGWKRYGTYGFEQAMKISQILIEDDNKQKELQKKNNKAKRIVVKPESYN